MRLMGWSKKTPNLLSFAGLGGFSCVLLLLVGGCKGDKGGTASAEVVASSQKVAAEEDDLLQRRDELFSSRKELRDKRVELEQEHERIVAVGGDASSVIKQKEELAEQEAGLTEQESQLNSKLDDLLAQRRSITEALASSGVDSTAKIAAREAGMGEREKLLAKREERLAAREAELGERERELARFKIEECAGSGQSTTIIQTVDAKGSKYTKKDVEPLLRRARSDMSKKGILAADLPSAAQGLETEATAAMAEGDYGRARFAAAQLVATVRSTKIDKAFVSAKIGRLSAAMKGKTLPDATQTKVDSLFRDATSSYGDGSFTSANRSLNKIYSAIR
jgi:chromosome segregation ATPase